jgi:hypothetical protein
MARKRNKRRAKRKERRARAKKKKFMRKIIRDGKISKKEARKANKRGISLRSIRNRNIRDYRRSAKDYDKFKDHRNDRGFSGRRPTYEPLLISRGAAASDRQRLSRPKPRPKPRSRPRPAPRAASAPAPAPAPAPRAAAPGPAQQMAEQIAQQSYEAPRFEMPDYRKMMDERFASYQSELESMRAEQVAAAEEYRRQADEQRRQFELAQRTTIGNEARAGQQAEFKLGSDPGMKRGGTYGFRRRRRQALMGGISAGSMLNV